MLSLLFACGPDAPTAVDVRVTEAEIGEADLVMWGAETEIEPYTDVMICSFGTYAGEDIGITAAASWQAAQGHHVVLLGVSGLDAEYPDGTVVDCTQTNAIPMVSMEPIIIAAPDDDGRVHIELPDGVATKLREGQRYVVQSHYVNTGGEPLLVKDAVSLELVPEADVVTWAAPFALTATEFVIPAGQDHTVDFDCTFDEPLDVLFINGHMHEWGTSFALDRVLPDTTTESLYAIDPWDVSFRDVPPTLRFAPGGFTIEAGTTLRTTCNWHNDTTEDLAFPDEMCATAGMVMPSLVPVLCAPE